MFSYRPMLASLLVGAFFLSTGKGRTWDNCCRYSVSCILTVSLVGLFGSWFVCCSSAFFVFLHIMDFFSCKEWVTNFWGQTNFPWFSSNSSSMWFFLSCHVTFSSFSAPGAQFNFCYGVFMEEIREENTGII